MVRSPMYVLALFEGVATTESVAQNFSSVKTTFADKLKRLKETGKSGAASTPQTPGEYHGPAAHDNANMFLFQILSCKPRKLVSEHPVHEMDDIPTYIHRQPLPHYPYLLLTNFPRHNAQR